MSQLEQKAWGVRETYLRMPTCVVDILHIKKDGYCSVHKHLLKSNLFIVLDGEILLEIWSIDTATKSERILTDYDEQGILPGYYHRFKALKNSKAIEISYIGIDINLDTDIHRHASFPAGVGTTKEFKLC